MSAGQYPGAVAATMPDKPAYVMAATGEVVTYAELDAAANRLSRVFHAIGLRPGDHVAFCLENHPRYLEIAWGAHYAGLIYTACSSRLTSGELAYIVNDCGAKAFVTSKYKADQAAEIVADTSAVQLRLMVDGTVPGYESYEAAVAAQPPDPLPDRREGADMLYSSGTTGQPKGVKTPVPDAPLGETPGLVPLVTMLFGFTGDSVYLSPAPMYHSAPLRFNMTMQRLGGTSVIMEHFDAEEFLALVEKHRVTVTQVVPTMFIRMLKLPDDVRARYDVSSLRSVVHAAAPCPVDVKQRMMEWWGPIIYEYYSSTEGAGATFVTPDEWLAHPGTVGKPMADRIHVLDDDGNELPPGEAGTVWSEGALGFAYRNDPAKTAEAVNALGYKTVGDIGYVDEEGYLYLTDRKAHMIIAGGVNIYPQEAENVLVAHPMVLDVAVIGVPDDDLGEQVKAVVQPMEWADAGPELEQELIEYCRSRLAHYKCPRSVDFERELPRLDTGKLYKRALRDRYWQSDR
jgi:acyl-CoA synthetase (AMP-forming)/AMP-acid ligase II